VESVLEILSQHPGLATFGLLVLCGLGLPPWSEEIVILASGYFVSQGAFQYHEAVLWCWAGILAGDSVIYGLGAWVGPGVYKWPILRAHMKEKHRHKFNRMFFKHGTAAVFIARFLPGFRMVAYFVAGNLRMRYWKFLVIDSLGAALTVPLSVWAGRMLADNLDHAQELFHKFQVPIFIFIGLLTLFLFRRRKQLRLKRLEELRSQRAERNR